MIFLSNLHGYFIFHLWNLKFQRVAADNLCTKFELCYHIVHELRDPWYTYTDGQL